MEFAKFLWCCMMVFVQEWQKFITPWFEASWYQPISKPIIFLDSPLTLEGLTVKSFASRQNNE